MKNESGFIIDKITNSIEHSKTGESFPTAVELVLPEEIKKVLKKDGWLFNWKLEFKLPRHDIYKLVIEGGQQIQGLLSITPIPDQSYIEMHLIENAPHNFGHSKQYLGVAGNLVAFACKMSFEAGFDGFVAFTAKTNLVDHYTETLGAQLLYGRERMAINTESARNLVSSYYKSFFDDRR